LAIVTRKIHWHQRKKGENIILSWACCFRIVACLKQSKEPLLQKQKAQLKDCSRNHNNKLKQKAGAVAQRHVVVL
jgi:hypothetical protein